MSDTMDDLDRRIVQATQGGLPLVARPYAAIAGQLGIAEALLLERLQAMLARGAIRRIGVVPNHYRLGYRANGMTVWDIDDAVVNRVGTFVGEMAGVSHCYRRPRHLPVWPYNLFAMVHARSHDEALLQIETIAERVAAEFGTVVARRDVLFSTRILKKTGLRLAADRPDRQES